MLGQKFVNSFDDNDIFFSKSTGKIRYVMKHDVILFTMVPTTGLLTPTFEGGVLLKECGLDSRYLVMMDDEASDFVAKGKSALAKFVVQASPELRPNEEVVLGHPRSAAPLHRGDGLRAAAADTGARRGRGAAS